MKLELGCGLQPHEGYIHHDLRRHSSHVDVAHDLDTLPWPWEDRQFVEVLAIDVMEHLNLEVADWLDECWRILRKGGQLILRVPAWDGENAWTDPTHKRVFAEHTFDYWDRSTKLWSKYGCFYFAERARWWKVIQRRRKSDDWFFRLQKVV